MLDYANCLEQLLSRTTAPYILMIEDDLIPSMFHDGHVEFIVYVAKSSVLFCGC